MRVKLGECVKQIRGVSYKPTDLHDRLDDYSVPLLRANNIQNGRVMFDDLVYVSKEKVHNQQYLKKGDILICTSSGSKELVGKAAFIEEDLRITFGAFCKVARPINGDAKYISYFFQSPQYRHDIFNLASGANINNIRNEHIENLWLPFPHLDEQRRIAAVLDKVTDLIAKRQAQLDKLDLLVKSRFVEMFGDFKLNSKNWPVVSFSEIAIIDTKMTTDYDKYADFPHIGIDSIQKDTGELKGYRTVSEDSVISGKYLFTPNHIIYSKIRPNLNKVALPDFEGLCSADAYPILPIEGKCNRIFLAYDMRSPFFADYILQFCTRTNLPKVNRKEVVGFKTPLPPLELQDKFSDFTKRVIAVKKTIYQDLRQLHILEESLEQQYFD